MVLAAVCLALQSYQWPEIKHLVNMTGNSNHPSFVFPEKKKKQPATMFKFLTSHNFLRLCTRYLSPAPRKEKEGKKKHQLFKFWHFLFLLLTLLLSPAFQTWLWFPALSFTFHTHCSICVINPIPVYIKISWDVDPFCSTSADCVCTIHGTISLSGDAMLWLLVWRYENIVFLNDKSRFRADVEEGEGMKELGV